MRRSPSASCGKIDRIALRQEIWGAGYTRPSSREFFLELVKPLGLNSDTTLNLYGCDLGRGACDAAEELGSYVRGFDRDPEIIDLAVQLIATTEVKARVEVAKLDPAEDTISADKTARLFCHNWLWQSPDKEEVLAALKEKILPGGQFLLTDLMLGDDASPADIEHLNCDEAVHDHLWTATRYAEVLESQGLDVRINEDLSTSYQGLIQQAWQGFAKEEALLQYGPETAGRIITLAELWTGRSLAMGAGTLKLNRLLALKH